MFVTVCAMPCLSQRSGQTTSFLAEELVPGDVVHFSVGDRVPADIRLVQVSTHSTGAGQYSLDRCRSVLTRPVQVGFYLLSNLYFS